MSRSLYSKSSLPYSAVTVVPIPPRTKKSPVTCIQRGEIASIRINVILTQPTRDKWERGSVSNEVIKRPLGTVPVDADGSAALTAPAGVPLQLQALDAYRLKFGLRRRSAVGNNVDRHPSLRHVSRDASPV